ncbi:hypothetical protein ASF76_02230 [Microbacterium sp. Leaf151]|nr:hypothetical protein ASF76_02230 [Microbacterium sp. Leaf151]
MAGIDVVALGVLASTKALQFTNLLDEDASRRSARYSPLEHSWILRPPHLALSIVREDVLTIRSITYSNPVDIVTSGKLARPVAQAVASFIDAFRLGKARKQLLTEQAARENIQRVIEDSTLELTVQEKFVRVEALILDNELKREELKAQKLVNIDRALELSERIRTAQEEARKSHPSIPVWSEAEATAIADNVRLLASVDLADLAGLIVRLENGPQPAAGVGGSPLIPSPPDRLR